LELSVGHDIPGLVVDHCIDAMLYRGVSVETCLRLYPSYEAELGRLLEVVESLRTLAQMPISPETKARAWVHLTAKVGRRLD